MKLSVVIPVFNEEEVVLKLYDKLKETLENYKYELLFIDDGSTDNTLNILKQIYQENKLNVKVVSFSRNFGKEAAMYAGLKKAKGEYTVIIDGDLQQNPKYLLEMIDFLDNNKDYDSICMKQNSKRFFQNKFYKIMNKYSNIQIVEGASDFRMFRKYMVESIISLAEKDRFSKGLFSWIGYKTYYKDYIVEPREGGKSKWSFSKLTRYALDGIINFSSFPLRIPTILGIISTLLSILYLLIILIMTILQTNIDFTVSIICALIFFASGIQLICISIIGEYLHKIFNETKNRPLYIEKEKIGFDESIL